MENSRDIHIKKQIDAYVKGKLTEDEIQKLWEVFAEHPEYLELLEIEVGVNRIIDEEGFAEDKEPQKSSLIALPKWTWHAAAAATILIVALIQLFRVDTPNTLDQFIVQQIGPEQLETADGIRSKDLSITEADSLLNLGFQAALTGNADRAKELYDMVIENHDEEPYGSKAFLNKGILLYNESEYELAAFAFEQSVERAEQNRMISEKAYWYLGNTFLNLGELEMAREAIFKAYQRNGVFRNAAYKILQKLNNDLGHYDYDEISPQQLD